jgi:hypothetical protein
MSHHQPVPNNRVLLDDSELSLRKRPGFVQDLAGDQRFAKVVQGRRLQQEVLYLRRQVHFAGNEFAHNAGAG